MNKKLTYFSIHTCLKNPKELRFVATEPHLKTSPDMHIKKRDEKIVNQLNLRVIPSLQPSSFTKITLYCTFFFFISRSYLKFDFSATLILPLA